MMKAVEVLAVSLASVIVGFLSATTADGAFFTTPPPPPPPPNPSIMQTTTTTTSTSSHRDSSVIALNMGLYDTPLPPRPGGSNNDDAAEKKKKQKQKEMNTQQGMTDHDVNMDDSLRKIAKELTTKSSSLSSSTTSDGGNIIDWDSELSALTKKEAQKKDILGHLDLQDPREKQAEARRLQKELEEARKKRMAEKNPFWGYPDQDWLPTKNPRPVDDEPWFTG